MYVLDVGTLIVVFPSTWIRFIHAIPFLSSGLHEMPVAAGFT